jgi:hypothetical protein
MPKYKHPQEHLITDECFIEIYPSTNELGFPDGYYVAVVDSITDELILREFEPDFDWAYQTAEFFSQRHNLEITDKTPY